MLSARPVSLLHNNDDYSRITASKTPGRSLKGRAGLQENVLRNGSASVNPKEKRVALQTPFHQGSSKIILQDAHALSKVATLSNARPLGDKTPKPNRQCLSLFTPGPRNVKPSKLSLLIAQDESDATSPPQPPSSSRKKVRTPRVSKCFETPITKGDHWNVSDVSIDESTVTSGEKNQVDPDELDDSEVEYMPPKPIEPPFEPPFELPDYKDVGQLLRTLAYSYPVNDSPCVFQFDSEDLLKGCDWSADRLHHNVPDSDDDEIFGPRKLRSEAGTDPLASLGTGVRRTVTRSTSTVRSRAPSGGNSTRPARPATSLAVRAPDLKSDPTAPRPGTSSSNTRSSVRVGSKVARVASSLKRKSTDHNKDNVLAARFADELKLDDDFRFTL